MRSPSSETPPDRPLVGIDIGGTKALLLAQWPDRRQVERAPTGPAFTGRDLDAELERFVSSLGVAPLGAGVAVPGLVGPDGALKACDVLPLLVGWRGETLGRLCPVRLVNDVEAASLEELHDLPAGSTAAVVMAGTGIGASFVTDGRPLRGARGWAGELGSIPIALPEGVATLDQLASGAALLKRLGVGAAAMLTRAAAREPEVLQALRGAGEALGLGLATVIDLFNPSVVAVGGGALELSGYLEAALASAERHTMPELWAACEVRRVRQGELTAALGALRAIAAELA
jgi:predicted NBD/HSP70 family sugar kinase